MNIDTTIRDKPLGPLIWARKLRDVTVTERAVLYGLINYDFRDKKTKTRKGVVWPSQAGLAADLNISRRTVIRAVNSLELKGLVTREPRLNSRDPLRVLLNYGAQVVSVTIRHRQSVTRWRTKQQTTEIEELQARPRSHINTIEGAVPAQTPTQ